MASYVKELHDIGILRSDGTTKVGLMLARDPQTDRPMYSTTYDNYFVQRAFAGEADYGATDPQSDLRMVYSDWRRGLGQYIFDSSDTRRYYRSVGMDLRFKGQAIAGAVPATVTLPTITATDEANLDWETWSDANTPGTWTEDLALARSATAHGGTYSGSITRNNGAWEKVAHQSVTWTTEYRSRQFHLKGWGRVNKDFGGGDLGVKFAIYDGVDRTYTGVAADNDANTWDETTWATHTVNASATELTIEVYVKGDNTEVIFLFDDMTLLNPTAGTIPSHADFNDDLYYAWGNNLIKLNTSTGTSCTYVYSFPATITKLEVFGEYLMIALGTSNAYWYMSTAEAFTQSTAVVNTFQFFTTVFTTATTLYGNDGANTIRSTTNPLNGGVAWSAQTTVGASFNSITDMIEKSGALYIMKEDRPYYLDDSGNVQKDLAPECATLTSSTSGKNVVEWLKKLYIPVGAQGLLETDGTTNTWRNPASYCQSISDYVGRVQALAYDDEWLFAIVDYSTKVEVLAGREEVIDGGAEWVWHAINEITLAGCENAFVSSVYKKRLWITSTSSSDALYYLPLPTGYGDIVNDTNMTFLTNSYFETPFYHGGFMGDLKSYIQVTAILGHAYNANIYFECHYKKLGDANWTDAGDFIGTSANRKDTLYIPVDASSNKPTSTMMKFKLVAKTNATTSTPILLNFDVKAILYPTVREIIECEVIAGDNLKDRKGLPVDGTDAAYVRTVLEEAQDATYPFTIYDVWGTATTVRMLPVSPFSVITKSRKDENPEEHFLLRLQKIPLS